MSSIPGEDHNCIGLGCQNNSSYISRISIISILAHFFIQGGPKKTTSKSNFFINAKMIVCQIQFLDQSSIYLMFKRGLKDISIARIFFGKQTRVREMVEIVVNRRPFSWGFNASTRFNRRHFASFCVVQSMFLYSLLELELIPHSFMKSRSL